MSESDWPELTFPDLEAECLRQAYSTARVILEYGSGGSTVMAAQMMGKLVLSVESDRVWARRLQARIDELGTQSPATVLHVDIGETGEWGRPLGPNHWPKFHRYPVWVWSEPGFRHPDVVLIDGRFRPACMIATMALCKRPVTVLFDDYKDRRPYHSIEHFIQPRDIVGRMAVFDIEPGIVSLDDLPLILSFFSRATYDKQPTRYDVVDPLITETIAQSMEAIQ